MISIMPDTPTQNRIELFSLNYKDSEISVEIINEMTWYPFKDFFLNRE